MTPGRAEVPAPAVTAFGSVLGAVEGIWASFAGFVGLLIFLILLATQIDRRPLCGSDHGGICRDVCPVSALFSGPASWSTCFPGRFNFVLAGLAPLGGLAAVGWPVLAFLTRVRQDIGWTLGRSPGLEPAIGVACYILALPIVLIGWA